MVKLTLVGRLSDGMPLAQTPTYMNEGNDVFSGIYRQKGEIVLKEIARGGLTCSKMSIAVDHHFFHYLIGEGVCCITLCDSWYPRKLAFYYLEDLQNELRKMGSKIVEQFSEPYSFKRFDYIICNTAKRYLDTRTQANLSKLKLDRQQDADIVTKDFSEVISSRQAAEGYETVGQVAPGLRRVNIIYGILSELNKLPDAGAEEESSTALIERGSRIWSSQILEVIALKWTPVAIFVTVALLLLWTSFVLHDCNNSTFW